MDRKKWKRIITANCKKADTYRDFFDPIIDTLSQIMETRDDALEQYEQSGKEPTIEYTNKAGATNTVKNPALVMVEELNKDALAYWRDLGLTPAGLRKINETALDSKKVDAFAEAMSKLGI